jgi:lipoprotein Spr
VFGDLLNASLPRSVRELRGSGTGVALKDARPGDLVFFVTGALAKVNHVGIFMGGGVFAHASTTKGVMYNSLGENYYRKRFKCIRRLF